MIKILCWGKKKKRQGEIYHIPFPHILFRNLASQMIPFQQRSLQLKKKKNYCNNKSYKVQNIRLSITLALILVLS